MQDTQAFPLSQLPIQTPIGEFVVHHTRGPGPAVVCWPSLLGDHRSVLEFAALLAPNFQVVLIDPPGIGVNNSITRWPLLSEQVELAHTVLDALQIDTCHWVGQGYGGHVGVGVATRFARRIRSLTLSSVPFVQMARVNVLPQPVADLLLNFSWGRRFAANHLARQLSTKDRRYERALVRESLRLLMANSNPEVVKQLGPMPTELLEQMRDMLKLMTAPTMIIAGQHDKSVLRRDQHTTAELVHGARYHEVDSGLMTLLVRPKECAEFFMQFAHDVDNTSKPGALLTQY